jgi:hypothetical protein
MFTEMEKGSQLMHATGLIVMTAAVVLFPNLWAENADHISEAKSLLTRTEVALGIDSNGTLFTNGLTLGPNQLQAVVSRLLGTDLAIPLGATFSHIVSTLSGQTSLATLTGMIDPKADAYEPPSYSFTLANGSYDGQRKEVSNLDGVRVTEVRTTHGTFRLGLDDPTASVIWDRQQCAWQAEEHAVNAPFWKPQHLVPGLHGVAEAQSTMEFSFSGAVVAVSEDGSTMAVGLPDENKVSVFHWYTLLGAGCPGWHWKKSFVYGASVIPSWVTSTLPANFGSSLKLSCDGSVLVVGAERAANANGTQVGAVYLFERADSGTWSSTGTLLASTVTDQELQPTRARALAVSCNGLRILAGYPWHNNRTGAVVLFSRAGPTDSFVPYGSWPGAQAQVEFGYAGALAKNGVEVYASEPEFPDDGIGTIITGRIRVLSAPVGGVLASVAILVNPLSGPIASRGQTGLSLDVDFAGTVLVYTTGLDALVSYGSALLLKRTSDRGWQHVATRFDLGASDVKVSHDGKLVAVRVRTSDEVIGTANTVVITELSDLSAWAGGGSQELLWRLPSPAFTPAQVNGAAQHLNLYQNGRGLITGSGSSTEFASVDGPGAPVALVRTLDPTLVLSTYATSVVAIRQSEGILSMLEDFAVTSQTSGGADINDYDTEFLRCYGDSGLLVFSVGLNVFTHTRNVTSTLLNQKVCQYVPHLNDTAVVCAGTTPFTCRALSTLTGATVSEFDGHGADDAIVAGEVHPVDQTRVVTVGEDFFWVWSLTNGSALHHKNTFLAEADAWTGVAWHPAGTLIFATATGNLLYAFDATDSAYPMVWNATAPVGCSGVVVHPTGDVVACLDQLTFFETATGRLINTITPPITLVKGSWNRVGTALALVGSNTLTYLYDTSFTRPRLSWFA